MDTLCCRPTAALQASGSSTHTCQAVSLAPRVLRHSRTPPHHPTPPAPPTVDKLPLPRPGGVLLETLARLALKVAFRDRAAIPGVKFHICEGGGAGGRTRRLRSRMQTPLGGKLPVTRPPCPPIPLITRRFSGI